MRSVALFLNGVYKDVLEEIISNQERAPGGVLYLQPYKGQRIAELHKARPTNYDSVRLYISISTSRDKVTYVAEIIGYNDKREMTNNQRDQVLAIQKEFQKGEKYDDDYMMNIPTMVNLLHVRGMHKLDRPFDVSELIKVSDGKPLSMNRSRSGGWAYVHSKG